MRNMSDTKVQKKESFYKTPKHERIGLYKKIKVTIKNLYKKKTETNEKKENRKRIQKTGTHSKNL